MGKRKRVRFNVVKDGQVVQPVMKNYLLKCCDCGLVHRMNFFVVIDRQGKARVQFKAYRVK